MDKLYVTDRDVRTLFRILECARGLYQAQEKIHGVQREPALPLFFYCRRDTPLSLRRELVAGHALVDHDLYLVASS